MSEHDYTKNLEAFLVKLNEVNNPSFVERDKWRLPLANEMSPLNGVLIGYEIESKQDREQLHKIGQQFGLIPLCPNDLVDLDISDLSVSGLPKPYVHSIHGKFYLSKPKLSS
ncbi:hypothetical protein [Thiococcus pfennigii]|uniref:hypothetical protein n=1 Tax=Thiococcus pfennigii TaxID=1057 RepID=UPI001908C7AA|nr:hypothetical protein [Thiococcus pfennigii]